MEPSGQAGDKRRGSAAERESGGKHRRTDLEDEEAREENPENPRVFAVYTYKGGAGKTTTTVNIGATLAIRGEKVLLVNCDPQCNMTSFFFPPDDGDEEEDGANDAGVPNEPAQAPTTNVDAGALPMITMDHLNSKVEKQAVDLDASRNGYLHNYDGPNVFNMLNPLRNNQPFCRAETIDRIRSHRLSPNLYLLPAIPRIIEFEKPHQDGHNTHAHYPMIRNGLRMVVNRICKRKGIKYAFIDFGPSASVLYLNWMSTCDFILPCAFPDYYNVASLEGLLHSVLPKLYNAREQYLNQENAIFDAFRDGPAEGWLDAYPDMTATTRDSILAEFRSSKSPPKILPVIVTNYTQRMGFLPKKASSMVKVMRDYFGNSNGTKPVPRAVHLQFVPNGGRVVVPGDTEEQRRAKEGKLMVVTLVQTFNTTQQLSHEISTPVVCINENLLRNDQRVTRILNADRLSDRDIEQHAKIGKIALDAFNSLCDFLTHPHMR